MKKILIIKLTAMGDIIQSAFILQFLKQKVPDVSIDWLCEKVFAPILKGNPHIDTIQTVDLKSLKKSKKNIFKEIKKLKEIAKQNYDIVIDLQGLLKSAIAGKIISKNLYGYDKNSARESVASYLYKKSFDVPYHLNTIDRYRLLVNKIFNINITKEEVLKKEPYLFSSADVSKYFCNDKKNIVFIIGASWKSKVYPKEQVKKVIDSIDANFIVPYSNKDEEEFANYLGDVTKVSLNLDELKALIKQADLVVGNDTGPTYIAWACNKPSVVLFGPVPPDRVYSDEKTILLKSPSHVDPYKLDKQDFSIKEIETKVVVDSIRKLA